jgi:hypothetical protein
LRGDAHVPKSSAVAPTGPPTSLPMVCSFQGKITDFVRVF